MSWHSACCWQLPAMTERRHGAPPTPSLRKSMSWPFPQTGATRPRPCSSIISTVCQALGWVLGTRQVRFLPQWTGTDILQSTRLQGPEGMDAGALISTVISSSYLTS